MIYGEKLFQRYKKPMFKGKIESKEAMKNNEKVVVAEEENLVCGDKIKVYLKIKGTKVKDARFEGEGCAVSMGSADLFVEYIIGKDIKDIKKMEEGDIIKLIGFTPDPARMHCATLPLRAVRKLFV